MNIFGLTPIDAALSALGLNCAQLIADFFFQTPLAAMVLISGLLLNIGRLVNGNYRSFITFLFLTLTVSLLLLPNKAEGTIASAVERYGQAPSQSSQSIKDQVLNYHRIPAIQSFLNNAAEAAVVGIVHTFDSVVPAWARYLNSPFGLQKSCLYIREDLRHGISDFTLRRELNQFLHDYYLPALIFTKHNTSNLDMTAVWPGNERISVHYSSQARQQWSTLEKQLKVYFEKNKNLSEAARSKIANLTQTSLQIIDQYLIKSLVDQQLNTTAQVKNIDWPWHLTLWGLNFFPILYGGANLVLNFFFPFLVLILVLSRNIKFLFSYLRVFAWVKSWVFVGAVSSYISLSAARLHGPSSNPAWSWEQPYFCMAAVLLLVFIPFFTFTFIKSATA